MVYYLNPRYRTIRILMGKELFWYNNAIIYAIDIGVFKDGNGDGKGDFRGATEKV